MSELYRSFIFVLVLNGMTFWVIKRSLPEFLSIQEFKHWRLTLFAVVSAAYLAQSVWVLIAIIAGFSVFLIPSKPKDRIIYYLLLVCTLPLFTVEIPGFGGIRYFFALNYTRVLTLLLLLGIMIRQLGVVRLFAMKTDGYVVFFVIFICYSAFRDNTFTNSLRDSIMRYVDIFIPYFVLSRYLDSKDQLNKAMLALLIGMAPFAVIGIFETLKHWHVFSSLKHQISRGDIAYGTREGALRASAIFGSPISLGYVMVISFGLMLYLKGFIKNKRMANIAMFAILVCLLATMARGPWVGLICLCLAYWWTERGGLNKIVLWTLGVIVALPLISLVPMGKKFVELLPFVGTAHSESIDYRTRLIQNAWIVFKRHPWFGSTTFLDTPEMESMRQGQGIIDLVNTFIQLALPYGAVGITSFLAIFIGLLARCYFIIKKIPQSEVDLIKLGRILFAILASILVMIATVSSIDYIPVLYWTFAGIIAAYLNVTEKVIRQHKIER